MSQSRKASAVESWVNVMVGYGIAILTQWAVFPLFGLVATLDQHMSIALIFTCVSLVRSYTIRRFFNRL